MELPELKPTLNYDKPQIISEDDLHWFANCFTLPIAAELARRSNLFPKLVKALEDAQEQLNDDAEMLSSNWKEDARYAWNASNAIDRLLAEIRQSEQEGGEHDSD